MDTDRAALPDDPETLKTALLQARAEAAANLAMIAHLKLEIAKLMRDRFGSRSEHTARLIDQMQLEELQAAATEDDLEAEKAAAKTGPVAAHTRKAPARCPLPVSTSRLFDAESRFF